jgi:hypothetical protein
MSHVTGRFDHDPLGYRWLLSEKEARMMSLSKSRRSRVNAGLSRIGTGAVRFFRAGYPDDFPPQGFNAAAALLPRLGR